MGRRDKRRSKERRLKKRMGKASTGRIDELLNRRVVKTLDQAKEQGLTALKTGQAVHALLEKHFKGEQR